MRVELAHAARLAAVGELTAAISHEINQPLGAVQSSADAAEMLLESPSPRLDRVREILANIRAANHRASEVVRRLRTLLHKHEPTRQTFDFNETVDDVLRMVDAELRRRRIGIESSSAQRPLWLEGDAVQIQQVVLNLLLNAMDAIGNAPAERRRIRVRVASDGEGNGGAAGRPTAVRGSPRKTCRACSNRSSRPRRTGWGSACRSRIRSSRPTEAASRRATTATAAPRSPSRCRSANRRSRARIAA